MIGLERAGDVAIVRLQAPPLNLLGRVLISALGDAFAALSKDAPTVAVLHCAGAGADVRELARLTPSTARQFITALHQSIKAVRDLDAPVIAAIDGPCLGAHLELAAACDLRICSAPSRFGMPEVRVGVPSVIEACLLLPICGLGDASRLVFEGELIDAQEALRIGLVNRVAYDLERDALAWAGQIARSSRVALAEQKRVLRDWTNGWYEAAVASSIESFARAFEAPETLEALTAFVEKRPRAT